MTEKRGCGFRKAGAVYWTMGFSKDGVPPERFIVDPPLLLPDGFPVSIQGVTPFYQTMPDGSQVMHLVDRIGMSSYPTPAHFFEEFKRLGLSRLIPRNVPFENLTRDSRLLLVHDRGYLINHGDYIPTRVFDCPTNNPTHTPEQCAKNGGPCCAGLWWENIDDGEPRYLLKGGDEEPETALVPAGRGQIIERAAYQAGTNNRRVIVQFNETRFFGFRTPDGITPEYAPAICFKFPARLLEVTKGGSTFDAAMAAAEKARPNGIVVQSVEF